MRMARSGATERAFCAAGGWASPWFDAANACFCPHLRQLGWFRLLSICQSQPCLQMAFHDRFLDQLDASVRERLLEGHREIHVEGNHLPFFNRIGGDETFLVSTGILKVRCLSVNGDEVVLSVMGAGSLIG